MANRMNNTQSWSAGVVEDLIRRLRDLDLVNLHDEGLDQWADDADAAIEKRRTLLRDCKGRSSLSPGHPRTPCLQDS